jgi:hypothetical protein
MIAPVSAQAVTMTGRLADATSPVICAPDHGDAAL